MQDLIKKELIINSAIDTVNYFISQAKKEQFNEPNNMASDEVEKWQNQVVSLLNKTNKTRFISGDFETAKSILEDEKLLNSYEKKELSIELGQVKLLLARFEDIDFEKKLAEIICGNNDKFPYYKGYQLSELFMKVGLPQYKHDGTTRAIWLENALKKLSIHDIANIIKEIFKDKYFREFAKSKKEDKEKLKESAVKEFQLFVSDCLLSNKTIDLSLITDTNLTSEMLFETLTVTKDQTLQELIREAKTRFFNLNDKQIALEKLWDSFERLKTYYTEVDKKTSLIKIIEICGFDKDIINNEFETLTKIGNNYCIRHHETNRLKFSDKKEIDYLFYRMLSLINFCIIKISDFEINKV